MTPVRRLVRAWVRGSEPGDEDRRYSSASWRQSPSRVEACEGLHQIQSKASTRTAGISRRGLASGCQPIVESMQMVRGLSWNVRSSITGGKTVIRRPGRTRCVYAVDRNIMVFKLVTGGAQIGPASSSGFRHEDGLGPRRPPGSLCSSATASRGTVRAPAVMGRIRADGQRTIRIRWEQRVHRRRRSGHGHRQQHWQAVLETPIGRRCVANSSRGRCWNPLRFCDSPPTAAPPDRPTDARAWWRRLFRSIDLPGVRAGGAAAQRADAGELRDELLHRAGLVHARRCGCWGSGWTCGSGRASSGGCSGTGGRWRARARGRRTRTSRSPTTTEPRAG